MKKNFHWILLGIAVEYYFIWLINIFLISFLFLHEKNYKFVCIRDSAKRKTARKNIKKINGRWKKGFVNGKLLNLNSESDYGYPGLKLDKKGSKIYGMIFNSKDLTDYIKKIDKFEGDSYKKSNFKIKLEDGTQVESYLYEIK